DDDVHLGRVLAEQRCRALGDVLVRRAVGAVAADRVRARQLAVDRVGVRLGRQRRVERRVEHDDVRHVRERLARRADAREVGRVVQRPERAQVLDVGLDLLVHDGGPGEPVAALDDAVADGDEVPRVQGRAVLGEVPQQHAHAGLVVPQLRLEGRPAVRAVVPDGAHGLPDPLEQPDGERLLGLDVDQLVLDRRRSRVDDQDVLAHMLSFVLVVPATACAWMAVMATVLTMSCTSAPRERSFTGLRSPCRTGPMATAPAERCTAVYVLLPVLRSGKMKTVARPATVESGIFVFATEASTAASYWMGPSTSRSGRRSRTIAVARRTFSTSGPEPDSPVEYESIATRGSMPNCAAVAADEIAMSASCSAVGSGLTAQSP